MEASGGPLGRGSALYNCDPALQGTASLEVYPTQFTVTQRSGTLNGSIANGSFRPNDYLAVTASFVWESASAGLHAASRLTWTRYALL
jgi:hypothetical protein